MVDSVCILDGVEGGLRERRKLYYRKRAGRGGGEGGNNRWRGGIMH